MTRPLRRREETAIRSEEAKKRRDAELKKGKATPKKKPK